MRVLDQTGTDSQLRNQISMVHKAIQTNLDESIGNIIPADFLFFDAADRLLQSRILPRKVYERTRTWLQGSDEQRLVARACGLVFLVKRVVASNGESGLRATVDTLADLLVDDVSKGSSALRGKLPGLLDKCELLIKVGDEYHIQTEESAAWNDEFLSERGQLANESHRIEAERDDRIRRKFGELVNKLSLAHGESKVPRELFTVFDSSLPADKDKKICVWVRDGWGTDENSVRADAMQAGTQSPTIFVFIPKRSVDDLRHQLMEYKAAKATIEHRGVPNTPEGIEAAAAMETTKQNSDRRIGELLDDAFSGARLFQGGGGEIVGIDLRAMVRQAAGNSLQRLFPQFHLADHPGWTKVLDKAQQGAPDALKAVGFDDEPAKNAVCKAILGSIAAGKKGADIRGFFEGPQCGWSRDAIDGALQVLLVAGVIHAQDEHGKVIAPKELERKAIGKALFKVEAAIVTAAQRIQIRKLLQKAGLNANPGEELASVPAFLRDMQDLADRAGGDAPKPARPDTSPLEEIRLAVGNEQLLALFNRRDELVGAIDTWTSLAQRIKERWPSWLTLQSLVAHADALSDVDVIRTQVKYVAQQRQLLEEPDLVAPLVASVTQLLRDQLNLLDSEYTANCQKGLERLEADDDWRQLEPEQRDALLADQKLTNASRPKVAVRTAGDVLDTLNTTSLATFADRVAAMPARFDSAIAAAATLLEPKAQFVKLPRRTVRTPEDLHRWLEEIQEHLKTALEKGPVVIQ